MQQCLHQMLSKTARTNPQLLAGDLRSDEGQAVVDACHRRYCEALVDLYDQHKDEYAPDRAQDMRFVE